MWKLYHGTELADWPLHTPQLLRCPKRCLGLPSHPHPCLHWPEALSPWHRLSGRSVNSPRPGSGIQSSLWPGAPVLHGNPPNLSGATESLEPEAPRHKGRVPALLTTDPLTLASPSVLCVPCPRTVDSLPDGNSDTPPPRLWRAPQNHAHCPGELLLGMGDYVPKILLMAVFTGRASVPGNQDARVRNTSLPLWCVPAACLSVG